MAKIKKQRFEVDPTGELGNIWRTGAEESKQREAAQFNLARAGSEDAAGIRQQQLAALSSLRSRAEGTAGPSVAETMMQRERDKNVQQAMALAASGQGVSPGAALRGAQQQAGQANIEAAAQAATLRAQEQQQAQEAYTSALAGTRGQDISQQGLEQQANVAEFQSNVQSELQQRQLNDQMVQQYTNMGMSLEEAQVNAQVELEKLRQQKAANSFSWGKLGQSVLGGFASGVGKGLTSWATGG